MQTTLDPVEFLASLGAYEAPHGTRSLMAHLVGTQTLLAEWGCSSHVQLAGLFHSIYSTSIYSRASVSISERSEVIAVIGPEAENLVFLFCIADRPKAFLQALSEGALCSRLDGVRHQVSAHVVRELMEVECANLLDQLLGREFLELLLQRVDAGDINLPNTVLSAVRCALPLIR